MADLNEMLLVLMKYQRTETEEVRRSVIMDIMEALVQRETMLNETRVIESIESFLKEDQSRVVSLDYSSTGLRFVTLQRPNFPTRTFKSEVSLMDSLAQCAHTLKNEQ